jgi:hypothetical protein
MDREEQRERDRQREEDRILAEQNPPKPAPPADPNAPSYAEQLKAWNERVKAGETKSHWTGD